MFVGSRTQLINALESMPVRGGVSGQYIAKAAADEVRILDKIHEELLMKIVDAPCYEDRWDRGYASAVREILSIFDGLDSYEATK